MDTLFVNSLLMDSLLMDTPYHTPCSQHSHERVPLERDDFAPRE